MLESDAAKLAVIQHYRDGRIRVGKIRRAKNLDWAEMVRESEAEMASGHLVSFRQGHLRGRHGQVLQSRVHGTVLTHRGRREGADNGTLGRKHSSRPLNINS